MIFQSKKKHENSVHFLPEKYLILDGRNPPK